MASDAVHEFTDDNFDAQVMQSDQPVLVDFWAEWCQPCRMLTPTIEALAADYAGKVKVGKMNVDDHKQAAAQFRIRSIPAVFLFHKGEVVQQISGLRKKEDYAAAIDGVLAGA